MAMTLLDTNVVSEILLPAPSQRVMDWVEANEHTGFFLAAVTQAELLAGLRQLPDGKRKRSLERSIEQILTEFEGRILPFDQTSAREYSNIFAPRRRLGRPSSQ